MTNAIASHPATTVTSPSKVAARGRPLGAVVAAACDAVAGIPVTDRRWETVGVRLTAVVDAVWRSTGRSGSSIGPDETVAPVLRLRDLGRLVQVVTPSAAAAAVTASASVEDLLWSLQVAAA